MRLLLLQFLRCQLDYPIDVKDGLNMAYFESINVI
jgi:hypothetical protein